ncbi:ParB/RepB/Spo0J family partition protein [Pseudodonghicola xiamenensis]|uniref:Chromosome partitioning protein ParB n=1 Tax=Pseudodonghicola xiamenensis TaxID=337702 RepID=A0A8J3HAT2_9RHOB|nr:ParB N-terminal domain-containing protein [Pseudodonghicola xiamenensis]GHG97866.1 chromosome partitioning protein ParB [Pseudodonghicola xiamenensis]
MAKRRRLTPAQPGYLEGEPANARPTALSPSLSTPASIAPPIAQVSGDAAARAALEELAAEMETARAQGLMLERLPLWAIEATHLVRDRLVQDEDEMEALMASLEARGQQTPIEVMRLPAPQGGKTYGLISGWRRLTALNRLYDRTKDSRFGFARALVVDPDSASDAYVAMVEENEIRVNLSFYERARIASRAVEEGVYPDARAALRALYGSVSRSKRSKIGSFMALVEVLDPVLRHPTAISEKLGLALVKALEADPGLEVRLAADLSAAACETPAEEIAILSAALTRPEPELASPASVVSDAVSVPAAPARPRLRSTDDLPAAGERVTQPVGAGVRLSFTADRNRIELTGPGVNAALMEALQDWLRQR